MFKSPDDEYMEELEQKNSTLLESEKEAWKTVAKLRHRVSELESQLEKNNPLLDEAADRIDQLEAELAKYRDAPVVAWMHPIKGITFVETYAGSQPLIVKPGEEK